MLDLLIREDTLIDGTGSPIRTGDLGVEGDHLTCMDTAMALPAEQGRPLYSLPLAGRGLQLRFCSRGHA